VYVLTLRFVFCNVALRVSKDLPFSHYRDIHALHAFQRYVVPEQLQDELVLVDVAGKHRLAGERKTSILQAERLGHALRDQIFVHDCVRQCLLAQCTCVFLCYNMGVFNPSPSGAGLQIDSPATCLWTRRKDACRKLQNPFPAHVQKSITAKAMWKSLDLL
jgi:hypothetical protein